MMNSDEMKKQWRSKGLLTKILIGFAAVFVLIFIMSPLLPFSLNLTSSMKKGLYYTYECSPKKGDIIQFKPSEDVWGFALDRGYITSEMEGLLKFVAGVPEDKICWRDDSLFINGEFKGYVALKDSKGRDLGHVQECVVLLENEVLPLVLGLNTSFDGRYFGPINVDQVQHCAKPILVF